MGTVEAEPPGQIGPPIRIRNADPRRSDNGARREPEAIVDHVEGGWLQRRAVEGAFDAQRLAAQPGPGPAAAAGSGLERGDEHRLRGALGRGDEVQAVVHAVYEVDVGAAGWPVHDPGSLGQAPP